MTSDEPTQPGEPAEPTAPSQPPVPSEPTWPAAPPAPTQPEGPIESAGPTGGSPRGPNRTLTVVLAILLVAALAGLGLIAKARSDERRRSDRLADRLGSVQEDLDDLRGRVGGGGEGEPGDPSDPGDPGDLGDLGDLLGDELGDLLGGGLDDLLGGDAGAMLECMGGMAALGDLGDLLGGGGDGEGDGDADTTIPDDGLDVQYDAVAEWVAEERDLDFDAVPEPTYVTSEEMTTRVQEEIRREYPEREARLDSDLLAALGVVDPGTDMLDLQADFVSGQVAGYYDPRTGELVVLTDDPSEPLSGYAIVALAHELDHALTDQTLDLPIDVDKMAGSSDEQMAATALIEGDATLLMYRFSSGALPLEEQMSMTLDPSAAAAQEALADAPAYLVSQLQFPYLDGLMFACGIEAEGGWEAVDGAYAEPPTTTAQILFPDRYASGEAAVDPPDPADPGGSWEQARARTFGAADLEWLFQAPGDDPGAALVEPRDLAAGWAGGEVRQWTDGDRAAVGLSFVQHDGEAGLCESITDWYRAAFPDAADRDVDGGLAFESDRQTAVLHCDGDNVRLGIAPDLDTATEIAG